MRVAGGLIDYSLRTGTVNQGNPRHRCGRDPWVVLADRTGGADCQTNNGSGEAWPGNRNRGGTPQRGGLNEGRPATLKGMLLHAPPFQPDCCRNRVNQSVADAGPELGLKASQRSASRCRHGPMRRPAF